MSELTTLFQNTADAIRSKTGDAAPMQASQFPAKIQGISVGISQDEADARYLQLSGGTMTGDLILNGAPTADNQAATKAYVDGKAGGSSFELLWSDPNPSAVEFPSQTVSADTSRHTLFLIECTESGLSNLHVNALCLKGSRTWVLFGTAGVNMNYVQRTVSFVKNNEITFGPAMQFYFKDGVFTQMTNDMMLHPHAIYGIM